MKTVLAFVGLSLYYVAVGKLRAYLLANEKDDDK